MHLSNRNKYDTWDTWGFYKGRYKNFEIKIVEGANAWSRTLEFYWVSFQSKKYEKGHNSLWENKKFKSIEEAKEWAIQWVDNYLNEK